MKTYSGPLIDITLKGPPGIEEALFPHFQRGGLVADYEEFKSLIFSLGLAQLMTARTSDISHLLSRLDILHTELQPKG